MTVQPQRPFVEYGADGVHSDVQSRTIMMCDDGIHPLDRDYSLPSKPPKGWFARLPKWHRIGFVTFGIGFSTLLFTAIVLGSFPGVGWVESIGSFLHRLAMYIILIGGLIVVVAYQAPRRADAHKERMRREAERRESVARQNRPPGVEYQDPTFGKLTRQLDDPVVAFTGRVLMPSGDFVSLRIENRIGEQGDTLSVRELLDQTRTLFLKIRDDHNIIREQAARELVRMKRVETKFDSASMDLVWIRFFYSGDAQLIYDISRILHMPWGSRTLHVSVDAKGCVQEGKSEIL